MITPRMISLPAAAVLRVSASLCAGAFLLLLALFAPAFKLVDVTMRVAARGILRQRAPAVPARPSPRRS